MFDVVCVTNRSLCKEEFLSRIGKIVKMRPAALILREKDLSPEEYLCLAKEVMGICKREDTPCILHTFWEEAEKLGADAVHLPLPVLRKMPLEARRGFSKLGASCHSLEEALECEALGCTYVTAGHIFDTSCKKDLPGRGLDFLRNITSAVNIPVYAIGGIHADRVMSVIQAGARGICVMSGAMTCENVQKYFLELQNR